MRKLSFILFILLSFAFKPKKDEIKFLVDGNPSCLERSKEYNLEIKFNSNIEKREFIVSGIGVILNKPENNKSRKSLNYKLKIVSDIDEIYINLSERDMIKEKNIKLKSVSYIICK
ncbi:MAG: hypothetical protein V4622_08915 [Bacteroidota bacterium]